MRVSPCMSLLLLLLPATCSPARGQENLASPIPSPGQVVWQFLGSLFWDLKPSLVLQQNVTRVGVVSGARRRGALALTSSSGVELRQCVTASIVANYSISLKLSLNVFASPSRLKAVPPRQGYEVRQVPAGLWACSTADTDQPPVDYGSLFWPLYVFLDGANFRRAGAWLRKERHDQMLPVTVQREEYLRTETDCPTKTKLMRYIYSTHLRI